jgi:hypothetical protein
MLFLRELGLPLIGLDNAGKTTILKKFNGEDITEIAPTLGYLVVCSPFFKIIICLGLCKANF